MAGQSSVWLVLRALLFTALSVLWFLHHCSCIFRCVFLTATELFSSRMLRFAHLSCSFSVTPCLLQLRTRSFLFYLYAFIRSAKDFTAYFDTFVFVRVIFAFYLHPFFDVSGLETLLSTHTRSLCSCWNAFTAVSVVCVCVHVVLVALLVTL